MAGLTVTFWPNPVYRNHQGELRWYFHVSLQAEGPVAVHLSRYRGEWYDMQGQLQESQEGALDIHLAPQQCLAYPELWVTSALPRFRYRLCVFGRDAQGREIQGEATLQCL